MEQTNTDSKKSKQLLYVGLFVLLVLGVFVSFLPWAVTHWSWGNLRVSKSNEIGDTIGGIMGPAVGLIAAGLTFLAFWAQYEANKEQRRQFLIALKRQANDDAKQTERYENERSEMNKKYADEQARHREALKVQQDQFDASQELQNNRTRLDLFENRFYMMLSIHRDNVNAIDVNGRRGREIFIYMIEELRFIYLAIHNFYNNKQDMLKDKVELSESQIYQIAYLSFFFGIGNRSTALVKDLVGKEYENFIDTVHTHFVRKTLGTVTESEDYSEQLLSRKIYFKKVYVPGVGHQRRLSHYVRHLFQVVKFVDDQSAEFLSLEQKYEYLSNLRAQLSTHEQLLLFYNSLSVLGSPWIELKYIEKYSLIKSVPIFSADFYKNPAEVFPQKNAIGKPMFEWLEIRERFAKL